MAFTKCSRCGELFHIRLMSKQALNDLNEQEYNSEVLCFGCFKELKEFDLVRIISKNPTPPEVEIGDKGAVLMVLNSEDDKKGYEIECVLPNGSKKWLGTFERYQLKWLQSPK